MNNVEMYEEYVKKVLKIPRCNFKGLDERVVYEIIVGLSLMYEMYPFFNRVISEIGFAEDINYSSNMIENSYDKKFRRRGITYEKLIPDDWNSVYTMIGLANLVKDDSYITDDDIKTFKKFPLYYSLLIGIVKNYDVKKVKDLSAENYGRYGMYHEFGHLLDKFLHISNSSELKELIKNHNIKEEISKYAVTDNDELVAEAFAHYIFSQRRLTTLEKKLKVKNYSSFIYEATPLVEKIGKLIDEKYRAFVRTHMLSYINGKYKFNRKYTFVKNSSKFNLKKIEDNLGRISRR